MNCTNPNLPLPREVLTTAAPGRTRKANLLLPCEVSLTGAELFALKSLVTDGPNETVDLSLAEKCLVSSVVIGPDTPMRYAVNRYGVEVLDTFGVQVVSSTRKGE